MDWKQRAVTACVVLLLAGLPAPASAGDPIPSQSHAHFILHLFPLSADTYPESVTVDQTTGTLFAGSVKEGTIFKGKVGTPALSTFTRRCRRAHHGDRNVYGQQPFNRGRTADRVDFHLQH
jgi:hypothetical protein